MNSSRSTVAAGAAAARVEHQRQRSAESAPGLEKRKKQNIIRQRESQRASLWRGGAGAQPKFASAAWRRNGQRRVPFVCPLVSSSRLPLCLCRLMTLIRFISDRLSSASAKRGTKETRDKTNALAFEFCARLQMTNDIRIKRRRRRTNAATQTLEEVAHASTLCPLGLRGSDLHDFLYQSGAGNQCVYSGRLSLAQSPTIGSQLSNSRRRRPLTTMRIFGLAAERRSLARSVREGKRRKKISPSQFKVFDNLVSAGAAYAIHCKLSARRIERAKFMTQLLIMESLAGRTRRAARVDNVDLAPLGQFRRRPLDRPLDQ